jgi:GTP-binding protein EngB required for normal cell division
MLILDNADDPDLDISQYFPVGNRGIILITSRNLDCKFHATVGVCELGRMEEEEAITLMLKTAGYEDLFDEAARRMAKPVVSNLGCLALAIGQTGALIRQGLYTMEEYCEAYSLFRDGQEVVRDMSERKKAFAPKCLARYSSLDRSDVRKPLKRRHVKSACPGPKCDQHEVCNWICFKCRAPIEYGYSDIYIHCDCGRSLYSSYEFKCNGEHHGLRFRKYDQDAILSILNSLTPSGDMNILILGEIGVGKSTFINAFVNYLTFETLDESMDADRLNWIIPCSFSTQIIDMSKTDGEKAQVDIRVGSRDDERDGRTGGSATQQTNVYAVTVDRTTIRLIDTPGIGDTRGVEHDKKNLADVLSTLSSYDELHGILILLKSNCSRLNVTSRFCVKELLTHLHRKAANVMVFGFTNTRISNYKPGDTFRPLSSLLAGYADIGLKLSNDTTYCFDSESFRFLAAYKNGITMENMDDFRRSWKHSRTETLRLIEYFNSQEPHQTKGTISLNSAREQILRLTKSTAEISQLIRKDIAVNKDKVNELSTARLFGDKLRQRLHVQKVEFRTKPLDKPKIVCFNTACTEIKYNDDGPNVIIHKTCQADCYLEDVQVGIIGPPNLVHCAAFNGTNYCLKCKHHWQHHMHVLYELEECTVTVVDGEVLKHLKAHVDDVTLRETAIKQAQARIKEYEGEQLKIQKAAARFGLFLKRNSITPYNDATLEYLDLLINEERLKIQLKGSSRRLKALQSDRDQHEQLIQVLTHNMDTNTHDPNYQLLTEEGFDALVKQLYHLPHFGKNLRDVTTFREMPFLTRHPSQSCIIS